MSNNEFYIGLTLGVYRVSQLFPKKKSLKTDLRELADEILVSLLCDNQKGCSENIKLIQKLFDLAESRGLADPRNFLVLRREYAKVSGLIEDMGVDAGKPVENSSSDKKNRKRQGVILTILKDNGKVKMSDLAKSFPGLNRRTLLRDMGVFCQTGVIKRNGNGRGACYTIKNATLYKEMSQF